MQDNLIRQVSLVHFGVIPREIERMTIGMCNEVYALKYETDTFILRMNQEKEWIYGTHKFLPLFKRLEIKTPDIIAEDYSKSRFPFCYQLQTRLAGRDLGVVFYELTRDQLTGIAKEVSDIFDKFKLLPTPASFGSMTGLNEQGFDNLLRNIQNQRRSILHRNASSNVIDEETINIYDEIIESNREYFLRVDPGLYYDDISSKNVMIHEGRFNGLVDLDFLTKGDYLEAIGRIVASWYGEEGGETYSNAIIECQRLTASQQKMVRVYAIMNLVGWMSEEGVKFNGNSTVTINWENVRKKKKQILDLYLSISQI